MPTRDDVARLAGVSGASVARAFNNPEMLSKTTYERIIAAAKALNYHPNYFGSVLRGKATKQIYAFCPQLVNPFFVHVYCGMEQYALEHDYQIFLTRTFNRSMIRQGRYDGFLFPVYNCMEVIEDIHFLRDNNFPFVTTDFHNISQNAFPTVGVDVEAAGYKAADHLFKLGHDNIVFATSQIDPKWVGIQKCCKEYGRHASLLIQQIEHRGVEDYNHFDIGSRCADAIAQMRRKPTAAIAATDEIATGLISRLTKLGYRVPQDLSVIGFDDTYIAGHCNPPLTTIHYPKFQIGYEMAYMLIAMLNGDSPEKNVILQTDLIVRESTSRPGCAASAK